jgi:hypothetical protein
MNETDCNISKFSVLVVVIYRGKRKYLTRNTEILLAAEKGDI